MESQREFEPTAQRLTTGMTPGPASSRLLSPGSLLGRYVVLERAGQGGMGVVYAAYDPVLERKIALKLLRVGGPDSTEAQAQRALLIREAQAMARLSHPNVVTVHDVGQHGDEVFIAMEFVDGGTLGGLIAARECTPSRALALLLEAGRGLEAAHRAGIVHRDFKPDNVLVGTDGRVLVTDFGIARLATVEHCVSEEHASDVTAEGETTAVTGGPTPGTPAYMSAEQHLGQPADERSDQFSFCVALWEAVYGERPYQGRTIAALAVEVTHGRICEPSASSGISPALRRALDRGLAPDPATRFESMGALLSSITPRRSTLQRWILPAAFGTVAAGAIVWAGVASSGPEPCTGADAAIDGVWSDTQRAAVREAWRREGRFAQGAVENVVSSLDAYRSDWVEAHRETCEATRVRGERSDALLDLGMACLMGRRASLDAAVGLLAAPDEAIFRRGLDIAGRIPSLAPCADVQAMSRLEPPPDDPQSQETIATLRVALGRTSALLNAGKYAESRAEAEVAGELAASLDYAPLQAEVLIRLGVTRSVAGEPALAYTSLIDAFFLAASHRDELSAARAAGEVMYALADKGDSEAATLWYRHADSALARIGRSADDDPRLSNGLGVLLAGKGDFEGAIVAYERALEVQSDPAGVGAANAINDLAMAYENQGKYAKAVELHERAMAIRVALGGPDHPDVGDSHNNIGLAQHNLGDLEAARESYERAVEIQTKALGPHSLAITSPMNNLGSTLDALGRSAEAKVAFQKTLAIRKAHLEPDDPLIASVYKSLGRNAAGDGDYALALEHYARVVANYEAKLGPEHPYLGEAVYLTAEAKRNSGAYQDAEPDYARALEVFKAAFPNGHPFIGIVQRDYARLAMQLGNHDVAKERAERALELIRGSLGESHHEMAIAHSVLARALHGQGAFEDSARHWHAALAIREADPAQADVPLFYGYIGLASASLGAGDPERAGSAVREASQLAPKHADRDDVTAALAFAQAKLAQLDARAEDAAEFSAKASRLYEAAGADYREELAEVDAWRSAQRFATKED